MWQTSLWKLLYTHSSHSLSIVHSTWQHYLVYYIYMLVHLSKPHYVPAVKHNCSSVLWIGFPDSFEEVQQGYRQLWSAIFWPLGIVKLQHCAAFSCSQLGRGLEDGLTWLTRIPWIALEKDGSPIPLWGSWWYSRVTPHCAPIWL